MNINYWNIEKAFHEMEKLWWNISKEKKWQYFFANSVLSVLERAWKMFLQEGYLIEYLWKSEDWEDFLLIISKVEILSAIELNNRNIFFNQLAINENIDLYDWWDVENI